MVLKFLYGMQQRAKLATHPLALQVDQQNPLAEVPGN
jgi:hypothetical protein